MFDSIEESVRVTRLNQLGNQDARGLGTHHSLVFSFLPNAYGQRRMKPDQK